MARKRRDAEPIRGRVARRRTEGDYMGVLQEAVTLARVDMPRCHRPRRRPQ
jgi:hypothetical protein